jgi:hypothetical protein
VIVFKTGVDRLTDGRLLRAAGSISGISVWWVCGVAQLGNHEGIANEAGVGVSV